MAKARNHGRAAKPWAAIADADWYTPRTCNLSWSQRGVLMTLCVLGQKIEQHDEDEEMRVLWGVSFDDVHERAAGRRRDLAAILTALARRRWVVVVDEHGRPSHYTVADFAAPASPQTRVTDGPRVVDERYTGGATAVQWLALPKWRNLVQAPPLKHKSPHGASRTNGDTERGRERDTSTNGIPDSPASPSLTLSGPDPIGHLAETRRRLGRGELNIKDARTWLRDYLAAGWTTVQAVQDVDAREHQANEREEGGHDLVTAKHCWGLDERTRGACGRWRQKLCERSTHHETPTETLARLKAEGVIDA